MRLRIATYNIHQCVGRDGIEAPERTAAVLKNINADVTALQEVAFDAASPGNLLDALAHAVDAEAIPGPTLLNKNDHYGNALLSRFAPAGIKRLDISLPGREPRGALSIKLRMNGGTARIIATHLGLRPGERRYQMRRILERLDSRAAGVTILLGDFNEWFLWGRPLRWASRRFGAMPAPATFPSHRPLLALDRIWVHPAERLLSLKPHTSDPAPSASDHLPLVADVAI